MTQYFYILTNVLNYWGRGNDLSPYTTLITLSTNVVSDGNKLSNGLGFYGKSTEYLQIFLYDSGLKLLLGLSFKIVIIRYAHAIMASPADVRSSNILG